MKREEKLEAALLFNHKVRGSESSLPLVNSGSGSFRKKDLSKLLITLRSLHFCKTLTHERGLFLQPL